MKLDHVLSRAESVEIVLDHRNADDLKKAALFWVGKAATKFRKDESIRALEQAFESRAACEAVVADLSREERSAMSIFRRYGPTVSGGVIGAELQARGLVDPDKKSTAPYYSRQQNDIVIRLCNRLTLVAAGGRTPYWHSYSSSRDYPELTLHPALAKVVPFAPPQPWKPSTAAPRVASGVRRSSAEAALDLVRVADALKAMGKWSLVKGDALSQGSRTRLHKLAGLRSAEEDDLSPPDPESLHFELLKGLGCLDLKAGAVLKEPLDKRLRQPAAILAWNCVRVWLSMALWQDGIGVVPDRDSDYEPVRIEPSKLTQGRELLVWALCRVAHADPQWLDLESFLIDLWRSTRCSEFSLYWGDYCWSPDFEVTRSKEKFPAGKERSCAFWMDQEGIWAANALMVTLVTLGLVERGEMGGGKPRPAFRLTELGRVVFGAPEIKAPDDTGETQFLTVQPNHEILAYLDVADASQIATLTRIADRGSAGGGQVQTFALRRDTLYRALESGLDLDAIRAFLTAHGKTPLPENVARSLSEWTGKRESLTLRKHVTLAASPNAADRPEGKTAGRTLADGFTLLPRMSAKQAAQNAPGWRLLDHHGDLPKTWTADEFGRILIQTADSLSMARLAHISESLPAGVHITETSIARARQQGTTADQVLAWIASHLSHPTPPLLETAIRNWTGRATAFLGEAHLLQVTRPQARDALLTSPACQPLLAGHIPPDWFLVREGKAGDLKRLLKKLGFTLDNAWNLPEPCPAESPAAPARSPSGKRAQGRPRTRK